MATTRPKSKIKEAFGDFQTPASLAFEVLTMIASRWQVTPSCIIEPTCGKGAFVIAAADVFPHADQLIAAEINPEYLESAKLSSAGMSLDMRVSFVLGNFFTINWEELIPSDAAEMLIIGNPPWVTTSSLGAIESSNQPKKKNEFLKGIEALTGKSNFDISEWMIYRYAEWLSERVGSIAILCKTSVARKAIVSLDAKKGRFFSAEIYPIDALKHFGASVDACMLGVRFSPTIKETSCAIYDSLWSEFPAASLVIDGDHLIGAPQKASNLRFRGAERHYVWRSGIKHDCSRVMELSATSGVLSNGLQEEVQVESEYIYPMLKSSCIGNGRTVSDRYMLVPQRKTGEVTAVLEQIAPLTGVI